MNELLFNIFPNERFIDLGLYQFGLEQCAPAHSFGPATRNHYLFHYVLSGSGTLYADNQKGETITYHIKSGQGFLIFPNQITTYIADEKLPWEYTWIEFDGLRAKEILDTCGFNQDNPIYKSKHKDITQLMSDEMIYLATHSNESPFHLIGHLYLIMDYFMQSSASPAPVGGSKLQDFYIRESINFIEQNFQNDISVVDIANVCGINRSYFGKIFKKCIGQTPQEFLMNYRMIKATELLRLTDLSISEISHAVGYDNPLHFSRAFKNIYNISPRTWRNQYAIKCDTK